MFIIPFHFKPFHFRSLPKENFRQICIVSKEINSFYEPLCVPNGIFQDLNQWFPRQFEPWLFHPWWWLLLLDLEFGNCVYIIKMKLCNDSCNIYLDRKRHIKGSSRVCIWNQRTRCDHLFFKWFSFSRNYFDGAFHIYIQWFSYYVDA